VSFPLVRFRVRRDRRSHRWTVIPGKGGSPWTCRTWAEAMASVDRCTASHRDAYTHAIGNHLARALLEDW
jgi:hypothetical protein